MTTHLFATGFPLLVSADLTDFVQENLSPAALFIIRFTLQERVLHSAFV